MDKIIIWILLIALYAKWIFFAATFPWACLFFQFRKHNNKIRKYLAVPDFLFELTTKEGAWRYIIINIGRIPSISLRLWFYRMLGVEAGRNVVIHYKTDIRAPYNLHIGKGSIIGDNALLDARNSLNIGENVNLSSNVSIYTEQHDYQDEYFRCTDRGGDKAVKIGDRAWLGSNVIVLPGVTIGEGVVCCAGSVVTKDVAPYDVVAGIPAKKIAERTHDLKYEFNGSLCLFY